MLLDFNIFIKIKATSKGEIIEELIHKLFINHKIQDKKLITNNVLEREKSMTTGFENSIAIPHAKTNGIRNIRVAIGIKKEGIDFNAIDKKPSKIFILIIAPKYDDSAYFQVLTKFVSIFSKEENRKFALECTDEYKFYDFLTGTKSS